MDWNLNPAWFRKIDQLWGPVEVDLFATRITRQCPVFYSWRPDPYAATDAFLQDWSLGRGFANPPWCLVSRVLAQVQSQQAFVILVAPVWKTQPWYSLLLGMLGDYPRLLGQMPPIVTRQVQPMIVPQLAVWPISGKSTETKSFQMKLPLLCLNQDESRQISLTTHSSANGIAGVIEWGSDPFSGPVSEVVNFLANLYSEGYKYNSLNSYRSAISSVHERVEGYNVGQHPLVTRLLKGIFNERPPLPKYSSTWDVQVVLNYLKALGCNCLSQVEIQKDSNS